MSATAPVTKHSPDDTLTWVERNAVYRRNFIFFLSDFVLFGIALQMIGATTVIPDFVRKLTDSEVLIALSSQMFNIGYLLPQLLVARSLTRVANKKWWFIGPNIPVRFVVLIFAGIIVLLGAEHQSAILVFFLVFYALAALGDGLVGVPWMDLLGSSLDDRWRARLFGLGFALTGLLMLGIAPIMGFVLDDSGLAYPHNYALLFAISGTIFVITIPVAVFIHELPGGKPRDTVPPLREYLPELGHVLRVDQPFRSMIIVRILVAFFTMATPFYIGLATERLDVSSGTAVRNLLLMQTLGSVSGSLLYARVGDRKTMLLVRIALMLGISQPVLALVATGVGPSPLYFVFLIMGIVDSFLGSSFVNWVVMYATPDQRPVYSGLFNSISAVALLIAPLVGGLLVEAFDYEAAFIVALVMIVAALVVAVRYVNEPKRRPSAKIA